MVGGGRMGVGANHETCPTIHEMRHGHLLRRGLGVHINKHRIAIPAQWHRSSSRATAGKGSSSTRLDHHAAHGIHDQDALPDGRFDHAVPRPGQPAGQLSGRRRFGSRSMNTSASRWSKAWLPRVTTSAPQASSL